MTQPSESITPQPFFSPEVRVVQASAGSGKTFALAKRYVQLLIIASNSPQNLRCILAITFTNKAAVEMKARILDFLKKIALEKLTDAENAILIAPLGITQKEASQRAFAVMEELIRRYNFFQVQTIDSFINALLSGCSFKIGLSANFVIKRNSHEYMTRALDRLIDLAETKKEVQQSFREFLHQYLFIENRSGWFPKKDLLKILLTLFSQSNFYSVDFVPGPVDAKEIFQVKIAILKSMKELQDILPQNTHATFVKKLAEFLKDNTQAFDIDAVSDYFGREEFPSTKGEPPSRSVEALWEKIRGQLKELSELEASSMFNSYIDVFHLALDLFRHQAVKEDVLFLEELNKKARSLFDEGRVTVEELYYRLATRFYHYLIDEFQDTSRLQWDNLAMMVGEALSNGGSLFYVGDKKQAIYGFRGGDSLLFDELTTLFANYQVQQEVLGNNWRSRGNIVRFNNEIFSVANLHRFVAAKEEFEVEKNKKNPVCLTEQDLSTIHSVFSSSGQQSRGGFDGGFIRVEKLEGDNKEDRHMLLRQNVLDLIRSLQTRYALGDIAILARDNNDVELMTGWLLEAGVDVHSERTSNVKNNQVVQELESLLHFLDSPIDNLEFAKFIMGDVFARAAGINTSVFRDFIFELRPKTSRDSTFYIYREFRERFSSLWETFFEDFFKNVGHYPLYEFTVSLIERLKVVENFPQDRGFIMHFLGVIKNQEKENGDLAAFLEYFEDPLAEDRFVFVRSHQSVRILTVHKSKGLEFPVVIIPSLEMDIKVGSGGKDGQQSFVAVHGTEGIHLVRLKDKYRMFSERIDRIYQQEYKRALMTELNNVYVALTRAVHELYVFIPSKAGNGFNPAQFLIPQDMMTVGEAVAVEKSAKQDASRQELVPALSRNWMSFLKDEFTDEAAPGQEARSFGEAVHAALSAVTNLDLVAMDDCLTAAQKILTLKFTGFTQWPQVERIIRAMVASDSLRAFFYTGQRAVLCEKEIVSSKGESKRIDRLIIGDGKIDVVDFKASRDEDVLHQKQVRQYMAILAGLYPSMKVSGWIIYWNDGGLTPVN
ncbi:MAG: UvrD-helicase domain-containing protein [Candidatus Omnitrophica bacterium]|nr:UvrD-helicase domain-containing protein [Candidatus Omnitrophota bacterium]